VNGSGRHRADRVRGLVIDIEPLRKDVDFRRLWLGQSISVIGNQITRVALPYQVYVLTGSTLALAGLVLTQLIPMLLFGLGGGAIADAVDRRRVLLVAQAGLALTSLTLALLRAAIALGQLSFNGGSVLGPALAGVLIATTGVAGAFAVDVATYGLSLAMIVGMRPIAPIGLPARPGLAAIREGLRFVRARRLIMSTFAIDLNAMIFGSPQTLYPVLALDVFKVGPIGLGLLASAPAAGALLAIVLSGGISRVRRVGRGILLAVTGWGFAILLFGLSTSFFSLALILLAIAGAADVISAVFRSSVVFMETPDELRGRVASIQMLVVRSGPQIGDMEAALVASAIGAQLSVISGGLLCLIGVLVVARIFPELDAHVVEPEVPAPISA